MKTLFIISFTLSLFYVPNGQAQSNSPICYWYDIDERIEMNSYLTTVLEREMEYDVLFYTQYTGCEVYPKGEADVDDAKPCTAAEMLLLADDPNSFEMEISVPRVITTQANSCTGETRTLERDVINVE